MKKKPSRPNGRSFIITSFFFLLFLCVLASINEIRFGSFLNFGRCAFSNASSESSNSSSANNLTLNSSSDDPRILLGILTLPDQHPRRHFLRMVYGIQSVKGARVDVRFVFCNLTTEDQRVMIALEIMQYDDIIILNCTENMNKGKTYTYFSSLPEIFNSSDQPYPPYHYVMKGDDDTYFRLQPLVDSLIPLSREDLYYGYVIPCESMNPFVNFMAGLGYLLSWDIVEWIRDSEIPKKTLEGSEDRMLGGWLKEGHKGKNRFNAKWSMYNYPDPPTKCTHELWPDTIAVHLLKKQYRWITTLNYFNVTRDLKPSKLYHIP